MSNATLLSTTLAGTFASIAESSITYPLEYVKTRRQMAVRPISATPMPAFAIPKLTSVFYYGWSAFVLGNALKTWLRFNVFNSATKFMSEGTGGSAGAPVVVVSGMMTGIVETLVVVPFESIKTTMIEASAVGKGKAEGALPPLGTENTRLVGHSSTSEVNNKVEKTKDLTRKQGAHPVRPQAPKVVPASSVHPITGPQGLLRTIRDMYVTRGSRAFVQGFNPTVYRQVTNSVLRFTSWNMWAQMVSLDGEEKMPLSSVLIGSGVTSAVEAALTQPLDVVKTRMQTANGRVIYGNSIVCAYKVATEEGWKQFFAGLAPRWIRKWVGAGIMWAAYDISLGHIDKAMREYPFK